jgi:butyryl-CoA dehydrogenase
VGLAATMLGLAGYYASLDYAKTRTQGRPVGPAGKDPSQAPVRLIEHADIKRMLLAQKAYGEGALALGLYCARLVDELHTGDEAQRSDAQWLLEVLTPIVKSWPSEWCLEGNSLAIQIHGGYGYTRDFPVEQYWRDQRLNMIHEGTHGIQAMDLLGRKVLLDKGKGLQMLGERIQATIDLASANRHREPADSHREPSNSHREPTSRHRERSEAISLQTHAHSLKQAWHEVVQATQAAWQCDDPALSLANAVPYMQAFGHTVIAWVWLQVAMASQGEGDANHGRRQACQFFFHYELPKIGAWLNVVNSRDSTCADMPETAF